MGNTSVNTPEPVGSPVPSTEVNLDYQMIYQRGIEAVLWSMPAISDVFFRESLFRDFGMKPGDVMVMSRPLVARHEVTTATMRAGSDSK